MISQEITALLSKGAIQQVQDGQGFTSNVFLVPKSGGKWRLILNLRALNAFLKYEHFKMEDIRMVKDILGEGEFMCKLDLKDAYLSVPVHPAHRKYLRFRWQGRVYEYTSLPFGLASAPRAFTKILKPVLATLRQRGIRVIAYLDDLLIIGKTKEEAEAAFSQVKSLLESLGFVINLEKSVAKAVQRIEFLGFIIDSRKMTLELPTAKVAVIRKGCKAMLRKPMVSVQEMAHLIGMMVATKLAVLPAQLYCRALQMQKIEGLRRHHSYLSQLALNAQSQKELNWWIDNLKQWSSRTIHCSKPEVIIESDASDSGWGAICGSQRTGGQWSAMETSLHINAKELLAAFLALQTFARGLKDTHVCLRVDNTTAVYYINCMGGTHSSILLEIAKQVWEWSLGRNLFISAEHLPGRLNTIADQESRKKIDSSEWMLDPQVFRRVMKQVGTCQVDLFASRLSKQLDSYMSWKPDPGALAVDALAQSWTQMRGYAFPPFSLIGRCLAKVKRERVEELVLIAPIWPTQAWFPVLQAVCIRNPIKLPEGRSLLRNPLGEPHPMIVKGNLQLAVWCVSGIPSRVEEFQRKQQQSSLLHGGKVQRQHIPASGRSGKNGVPGKSLIRYVPL